MTKKDIVESIKDLGMTGQGARRVVDMIIDIIKAELAAGQKVQISGFGSFDTKLRRGRSGRNPKTGEKIKIPSKRVVVFNSGKNLKDAMDSLI